MGALAPSWPQASSWPAGGDPGPGAGAGAGVGVAGAAAVKVTRMAIKAERTWLLSDEVRISIIPSLCLCVVAVLC